MSKAPVRKGKTLQELCEKMDVDEKVVDVELDDDDGGTGARSPSSKRKRSGPKSVGSKSTGSGREVSTGGSYTRRRRMLDAMKEPGSVTRLPNEPMLVNVSPKDGGGGASAKDAKETRLTEGINVLSWDCGLTNLCYCLLCEEPGEKEFRVVMWENLSLNSQTLAQAIQALVRELDSRPFMMDVDYVCIENQVLKNVQMKCMSFAIQCYFLTRASLRARHASIIHTLPDGSKVCKAAAAKPSVHFIKAESKFQVKGDIVIPDKIEKLQRRRRNKRAAEFIAETLLRRKGYHVALNFMLSFTKRDDLSDSFLQGLYFLRLQKQRKAQRERVTEYLGMKDFQTLSIDTSTGTGKEEIQDCSGINEGCEYDKEVPLPQIYRCENFVVPRYSVADGSAIAPVTRYVRASKSVDKGGCDKEEEEEEVELE